MAATLERQIYEAIRGKCVSDASAERAAALAAELAIEKFTSTNSAIAKCSHLNHLHYEGYVQCLDCKEIAYESGAHRK
jgi:hypothetical protein